MKQYIIDEIINAAINGKENTLSAAARDFLKLFDYPVYYRDTLRQRLVNNWGVNTWDNFKLSSADFKKLKERADAYDQIVRGILLHEKTEDWRAYLNGLDDERLGYVFFDHWGEETTRYTRPAMIHLLVDCWLIKILDKDILFNPPKNY